MNEDKYEKKSNGILLLDILINIVVIAICIYKTYKLFSAGVQINSGMYSLYGYCWVFGAVVVAGFLVFDFLCLRSRKKDEVNSYNEAYVTMSLLLKAMVGGMAIVYFILV